MFVGGTGSGQSGYVNAGISGYSGLSYNPGTVRFGIGTISPGYTLDIQAAASTTVQVQGVTSTVRGGMSADTPTSGAFYMGSYSAAPLAIGTVNSERVRITTAGFVGINTTTPGSTLQVNGGIVNSSGVIISAGTTLTQSVFGSTVEVSAGPYTVTLPNPTLYNGAWVNIWLNTVSTITLSTPSGNFYGPSGSAANTLALVPTKATWYKLSSDGANWIITAIPFMNSNGHLGIGTISPAYSIDVTSTTGIHTISGTYDLQLVGNQINTPVANYVSEVAVNYTGYQGGTTQYRNFTVYNGMQSAIAQFLGSTSSTTFNGGGSNTSAVTIQSANTFGGVGYAGLLTLSNTGGGTNSKKFIRLGSTGTLEIINNAYNSAILGLSDAGSFYVTGEVTAYASDIRLKDNVTPIANALEKISAIRGVTFDWNAKAEEQGFKPEHIHDIGVIAQEINAVLPEAVRQAPFDRDLTDPSKSKSGENYLTVQYEKLTALLIEAVKELNTKVIELQNEIILLKK